MKLDIKTWKVKVFIKNDLKSSWNKEKFDIQLYLWDVLKNVQLSLTHQAQNLA